MNRSFFAGVIFAVGCSASSTTSSSEALGEPLCPASPPVNGSACDRLGTGCSWGSDDRFGCRTLATCGNDQNDSVWVVTRASCPEPPPRCPSSAPDTDGGFGQSDCTELGATCVYGDTAYTCTPCSGTLCWGNNFWSVSSVPAGCPDEIPNLGVGCASPGLWCNYNVCADDQAPGQQWAYGMAMKCKDGAWVFDFGGKVCL